jgi:glycosyltransferase involved in cell wall biosynthesis
VVATGFVADVRPYFRRASIFLCPIRVGGGTRLKVLDALAMAKPVISTAIGVEGLELTEGEHYLRAETAAEFVAQIERLEREPALAAALGTAGRARVVERYDWSVIGRRLDAAYARAAESAPALRSSAS